MPEVPQFVEMTLGVCMGLGLAAACGFRIFVPLLVVGLASQAGMLELHGPFAWIGSLPAVIALAVATVLEVLAYFVPFVDNLLDTVATPAAAVAGAVVALAVFSDMDPWLYWSLGIVAGGGVATAVQVPIAAARGGSSVATAGVANPALAAGEVVGAGLVSSVALFVPIAVPFLLVAIVGGAVHLVRRRRRIRLQARTEATPTPPSRGPDR